MPIPHYYDSWNFIVCLEVRANSPTLFFFKIVLALLGTLHFSISFRINLSIFHKRSCRDFYCDFIEPVDQIGKNWPVHNFRSSSSWTGSSFHFFFFFWSLISVNIVYSFWYTDLEHMLSNLSLSSSYFSMLFQMALF